MTEIPPIQSIDYLPGLVEKDEDALRTLIENTNGKLVRFIQSRISGKNREDAEDLASIVYYKVWSNIADYDPERASLEGWLMMLAKYAALDFNRKVKRKRELATQLLSGYKAEQFMMGQLESHIDYQMYIAEVVQIIESLEPHQQDILILRFLDGMTFREIGEQMGAEENTVKTRYHRTVQYIRRLLKQKHIF